MGGSNSRRIFLRSACPEPYSCHPRSDTGLRIAVAKHLNRGSVSKPLGTSRSPPVPPHFSKCFAATSRVKYFVKTKLLFMLLAALFVASPALSDQNCGSHDDLRDYLQYQKRTNTAVVYTQCGQQRGKSVLILR